MDKCQARDYCKLYKSEHCTQFCGMYSLLQAIYSLSNIPLKYQYDTPLYPSKDDLEAYKWLQNYMDNIKENVSWGKGIFIWSEVTGNGKTTWATKIANHYIRKVAREQRLENIVTYVNIPTYLERIRRSFNEEDKGLVELNTQVLESDLVIFDDIGAERASEWVQEQLYRIINHRDNNLKSTIYTSNVAPETLRESLGDRNYSRIINGNTIINFTGGDKRAGKPIN